MADLQEPGHPPPDSRLEEIILAVRDVFASKGFDRASMQDLARAAGMSAGNFYRYFPSKDAIIETLVRRELAGIEEQFVLVMAAEDPLATLTAALHEQLESYDHDDCAIWMEVLVSARRQGAIGQLYEDLLGTISGYLVTAFARVLGIAPEAARQRFGGHAEMILLMVQGVHLHRCRVGGQPAPGLLELAHRTIDQYLSEIAPDQVAAARARHPAGLPQETLDA